MMEQLATRCPHCQTGFRVTQAQLDFRAGQVRCGVCRNRFDGIAQRFDYLGTGPTTANLPTAEPQVTLAETEPATDSAAGSAQVMATTAPAVSAAPSITAMPAAIVPDHAAPIVTVNFGGANDAPSASAAGSSMEAELDALSQAIADLRTKPWAGLPPAPDANLGTPANPDTDDENDGLGVNALDDTSTRAHNNAHKDPLLAFDGIAPESVVLQSTRRRSRGRRIWKILLWTGIPLLTLTLAAQVLYQFRNDIAARSPQAARQLRTLCVQLGCTIRLPMQLEKLSLVSSQLDAAPLPAPAVSTESADSAGNSIADKPRLQRMTLVALLRNQGNTAQSWPSIDVQLKDTDGKVTVRKAFLPAQYRHADEVAAGMSPHSEIEIRIPFELAGEVPASFEATLFYH